MKRRKLVAALVGKAQLCAVLGWARSRLDRRLDADAGFPVQRRGTRAGGWAFDVREVLAYLDGAVDSARSGSSRPTAVLYKLGSGAASPGAHHRGEMTATQRLKNAQAARVEDALRLSRRELVEAEEMRLVLGTMLARLGKGLDSLADMVPRRLGLPEETSDVVREMVDQLRRDMVTDLKAQLAKPNQS